MKLLFVISEYNRWYSEYVKTGHYSPLQSRSVEIELSKEQIEQIGLSEEESIESISLLLSSKKTKNH